MVEKSDRVLEAMFKAEEMGADLLEWRLDVTNDPDVEGVVRQAPLPIIATVRSVDQGGRFGGSKAEQLRLILQAATNGCSYLDWEFCQGEELPAELSRIRNRVILSYHNFQETPLDENLVSLFQQMTTAGAEVVKVVTRAQKTEDNLTVLSLIGLGRRQGQKVVAFCLGPLGRISRVACLLVGGAFTYAALETGAEAAPGQLTVSEIRQTLELLR
jgi:3-dehydroquinate dehydratase type I